MQAVVTAIGGYNGVPAFEYEVRDPGGRVQAFDFVIIHPHEGETWDDLADFVRDFIARRAALWALSNTPAKRRRRQELLSGGVRLWSTTGGTIEAPELAGERPSFRHWPAVDVSEEAARGLVRAEEV